MELEELQELKKFVERIDHMLKKSHRPIAILEYLSNETKDRIDKMIIASAESELYKARQKLNKAMDFLKEI